MRPRLSSVLPVLILVMSSLTANLAMPAQAVAAPLAGTVTQDALPTVQVNGVVWDQVTVGNTVYAVGDFTSARPAGVPAGTDETPRTDILAYDITTGRLITSFHHTLNGQVLKIAASPNGSRIYIGGQFTSVDGESHYRLAAFDTGTGDLVSGFDPATNATVSAIAATDSAVYFGGNFGIVDGNNRIRLAAVNTAGDLTAWAPSVDGPPNSMLISPGTAKVIVAGGFSTLSGTTAHAIGALDPVTGATLPWAMSTVTTDGDVRSGFLTLSTDGRYVYAGGWRYLSGDFEGLVAMSPSTGRPVWMNDCWGDNYSTYASNGALYVAGHAHNCHPAGSFPDTTPPVYHFALAWSTAPSTTHNRPDGRGWNWGAYRTSPLLQWDPAFAPGSFTGKGQAVWSVTGNGTYVAFGGEFPSVNGTAQQGLVRFTTHAGAPNAYGPAALGTITARPYGNGVAVTTSTRAYDPDDGYLTYQLVRDNDVAAPIETRVVYTPRFWQSKAPLAMVDTSGVPGTTYSYRLRVVDPAGRSTGTNSVTITYPAG